MTAPVTENDNEKHSSLSDTLQNFIHSLDGKDTTLADVQEKLGNKGFCMLLLVLSFPAALPLPAPGYATPFGLLLITLGWQMLKGNEAPWLPENIAKRTIKYSLLEFCIKNGNILFRIVEKIIRPRLTGISRASGTKRLIGGVIILLAALMALPIPLTNTAPSFVIFMLAAGLLEEDGLVLLGGLLLTPIAMAIAIAALYYAWTYGMDAVEGQLKPIIKSLLGMNSSGT